MGCGRYEHWARLAGVAHPKEADPSETMLKAHAKLVLKALRYDKRANARWEILIETQLAEEAARQMGVGPSRHPRCC